MGVSGCGKSTLGKLLAQHYGRPYIEGDELHPPRNVESMAAGIALTDDDRHDWLQTIARLLREARDSARPVVVTCSALKRSYRDLLRKGDANLRFVFLHGDPRLLAQRMAARSGHYMPASLLDSQLATLEPPGADEQPIRIDIATSTAAQLEASIQGLSRD